MPRSPDGDLPANLAAPARRALDQAGYTSLGQLAEVTESTLGELHGMGPKALRQLRDAMDASGLRFATEPRLASSRSSSTRTITSLRRGGGARCWTRR